MSSYIITAHFILKRRTDVVKENKKLHGAVNEIYDSFQESQKKNLGLQKENKQLSTEISSLKAHIRDL